MRLLKFVTCALAVAAASARPAGSTVKIKAGNLRAATALQQVTPDIAEIELNLADFSALCAQDFFQQTQNAQFAEDYSLFFEDFVDTCAVRVDADFSSATTIINTDPCEEIVQEAEAFEDSCMDVDAQLCSLVVDETVDLRSETNFFMRSVYTYYICVPETCNSADVADALDQALDDLTDSLTSGSFFEDPDLDVLASTTYEGVLFCDAEGFPARFGQGFALDLELSGASDAADVSYIAIASDEDGSRFLVPTLVVPDGLDFTFEIYGTNAAAELNADIGFQDAGCVAYWRTETLVTDSYLQIFCPTDDQIYAFVSDVNGNPVTNDDPVPIQQFVGLGFSFTGEAEMDEFETPDPTLPQVVITTGANGQPGVTPPIPTLGANGAASMAPTLLVAAASLVVAALAL